MENLKKKIIFLSISLAVFFPLASWAVSVNLTAFSRCTSDQAYIDLTWNSDLTSPTYYVQRKVGAGDFVEIYSTLSTSWSDAVDSDKDYTYKIRAVEASNSYYSNEQFIAATYCPPVLSVSSGCIGSQAQANLNWLSGISGDPSYYVLRKIEGGAFSQIAQTSGTSYQDQTIDSDKNYIYLIKAEKGGDIYYSNQATGVAVYCPPTLSPPQAICQDDGPHIILNWSPVSGNLLTYEIYRDSQKISETTATTYNNGLNIEGARNYDYFIKAVWRDGRDSDSETAPVVAPTCPPILNLNSNCLSEEPGGPQINLSWNNLLGVQNYQIYRKVSPATSFSFLGTTAGTSYADNLVDSLTTYAQAGQISYYIKAFWIGDQKDSSIEQIETPYCQPYLEVDALCNSSGFLNPEMRISFTATRGATHYNIYRDGQFRTQITATYYTDYLDPAPTGDCPGKICTHTYKADAIVTGFPAFSSNEVTKDIDCATPIPPSPAPVLSLPSALCVSGDSQISISWTASDNVVYYTLYRDETGIINLLGTSYVDSAVESGHTYTYRVTAFGQGGTYTNSINSQTATALDCTPPSTPILSLSGGCENGKPYVNLSWTETTNTLKYEIFRGTSLSGITLLTVFENGSPEFSTRTWKDISVSASTNYYYQVVASGPIGVPSSPSDIKSISTLACLPTTPILTLNTACEAGNALNNLSWTTDEANTSRYEIFRYDFSTTTPIKTIFDTSVKNWKDTNVLQQTAYRYKVEAVGYGSSPPRATQGYKNITTYNCSAPGPFTLSDPDVYCQGSYPRSGLSWSASSNFTSYDLFQNRLNPDNSIAETNTFANALSPFTDLGFGKSLSFDGYYDYVNVANSPSLNPTRITLEAWIYPTSFVYYGNIFNKRSPEQYFLRLYYNTGRVQGYVYSGGAWRYCTTSSNVAVLLNRWNHILFAYDGSAGAIYVNGVQGCTFSYSGDIVSGTSPLRIGTYYTTPNTSERFNGVIDEARIYSRALNATEISQHYNGTYTDESGLVGLWHFDEGSGQTVSDSSNSGNNGTLGANASAENYDPTWVLSGLQFETKYNWQAKAIGPGGSTLSNITNPTLIPLCQPTKPGLVLTAFCEGGTGLPAVTLKWSYTINSLKYEIYRQGAGLIKTINQGDAEFSSRTWSDNNGGAGLSQDTNYTYYIIAIGSTGLSAQSDSISITTPTCSAPTKPQNLTANFSCAGAGNSYPQVNLSWDASTNATSYSIYRNSSFLISTALTSYVNVYSSVTVNRTYTYYVVAYGPGGSSPASDLVSITTGFCQPSKPSLYLATACESSAPANNLYWSDSTTFNTSSYQIYRNTTDAIPGSPIKTITSAMPEFTSRIWKDNSGLSALTNYYYWVKAVGPAGQETSDSKSATTYSCGITPAAPSLNLNNLYCSDNFPYAILSWTTVPNAYSYHLYRTNPDSSASIYSTRLSPLTDRGSSSLRFDGLNDYVNIPDSSSLQTTGNLTISFWAYPTNISKSRQNPLGKAYGGEFDLTMEMDGKLSYYHGSAGTNSSPYTSCQASNMFSNNTWVFVAVVRDVVTRKITIYKNGIAQGTPCSFSIDPSVSSRTLRIGYEYAGYWEGLIDEIRIYGRALTGGEILKHYQSNIENEPDLRGAWHFDEGSGITALDGSGKGNSGTLNNDPAWVVPSGKSGDILPLENGKTYKYTVKALGADTQSSSSNEIVINSSCLPAKPDFTITSQCSGENPQLLLSWSNDPNTIYWSVYKRRTGETSFALITNIASPQISFPDVNVESGIGYEYYLEAVGVGVSAFSDVVSEAAQFCYLPPSKPGISSPYGSTEPKCFGYSSRIFIDWEEDPTDNTVSYNIWRKNTTLEETDFSMVFNNLPASITQYADIVSEAEKYIYKVEAVGSGIDNTVFSDPSQEVTAIECSKVPPFPPNLYLNLIYSVDHQVAVSIGWSDAGNEEQYEVFRRLEGESEFPKSNQPLWWEFLSYLSGRNNKGISSLFLPEVSLAAYENPLITLEDDVLNYVDYTVTDGVTYEYQIVASNINGETLSNIILAPVPIARPGDFTLAASYLNDRKVYLSWTEALSSVAGGQVTYEILRSSTGTFDSYSAVCSAITTPRECYDNDPTITDLYYKAVATNNGGITNSNVFLLGLPTPTWKEIFPQ